MQHLPLTLCEAVSEYMAAQRVHKLVLAEEERKLEEEKTKDGMVSQVQREFNCGDEFLLIAAHALLRGDLEMVSKDSQKDTADDVTFSWQCQLQALVCLQVALKASPDNFHLRLLIMCLYSKMGVFHAIVPHYDELGPKHVQLETLSFLMLDSGVKCSSCRRGDSIM